MPRPPHDSWVQGNDSGVYTSPVDKFLVHTTEGSSIAGAVSAYQANNSWPHLTVDCQLGHSPHICGHLDLDVPARSLRNQRGGVETNRDGVIQIEVVGFATRPDQIDWVWLGANVVGPICRTMGIPVQSSVRWVSYPASYGENASQRLSAAAWGTYKGVLGHQHCPENSHGDPGAIPIELLLDAADQEDDDLPYTPEQIEKMVANGVEKALAIVNGKPGPAVDQMHARVAQGVEDSLAKRYGHPDGAAVDQMHARVRDGVELALDTPRIQEKIRALVVDAVAPEVPEP